MNRTRRQPLFSAALALLAFAAPAAYASSNVDITKPLDASGSVSIELVSGSVTLKTWDRNEVHVTGTIGEGVSEVSVTGSARKLSIEVELQKHTHNVDGDARLEITIPKLADVDVESVSAPVTATAVGGRVGIETVSGGMRITGSSRRAKLETVSGKIEFATDKAVERLSAETVSGSIGLDAVLDKNAEVEVNTVSGTVALRLPQGTSAEVDVSSFSGSFTNEFSGGKASGREHSVTLGDGGARVSLNSFSGSITLQKKQ